MAYHIKNWDEDHENSDTRRYADLLWYRSKVKLMGEGFGHTVRQKNGPHLYGMFKIIEQLAASSRKSERGWLIRNGTPMDASRMSNLLRIPVQHFEKALAFFSKDPMDWLEYVEFPGESPRSPETSPASSGSRGESPRNPGKKANDPETARQNTTTGERTNVQPTDITKKETMVRFATPEAAASAQARQWAAAKGRTADLESIPEESRSPKQDEELKKMRALSRAIQKKQAAGDFTPVDDPNP